MKKYLILVILTLFASIFHSNLYGWGIWAHSRINRGAVLSLPKEMGMFFYIHADYMTQEAIAPDERKHLFNDKYEKSRHHFDFEAYNCSFDKIPKNMVEAKVKFNKDTLLKYGTLPWTILDMTEQLTNAFKDRSKGEILFIAANLGHYIGDALMPLHNSINHDGQLTDQKGIHGLWEAQIPELFGDVYTFNLDNVRLIENISEKVWMTVEKSNRLADSMLLIEKKLSTGIKPEKIFVFNKDNKVPNNRFGQPIYRFDYAQKYNLLLNGMVEMQMKESITLVRDIWYTAWVNAGKPDLAKLDSKDLINYDCYYKEIELWRDGKLINLNTDNEY